MNIFSPRRVGFNADISAWDLSNVSSMARMFFGASHSNQPVCRLSVSKV
eukprot:gene31789-38428_t